MVVAGRQKSIAFFIALGAGLISVILLLYVGWVLLNWRQGILLFFGILLLAMIIAGVVLNTTFLVREIRRNEEHDAFINAVTHELKTPVASIRLYLETLQTRSVDEEKRQEFYRTMLADSDRLLATIEQVLRTGRLGRGVPLAISSPMNLVEVVRDCVTRARTLHNLGPDKLYYEPAAPVTITGDIDEVRAAVSNLLDNAIKYSGRDVKVTVTTATLDGKYVEVRVTDLGPGIPQTELKRIFKRFYRVPGPVAARVKGTGLGLFIVRSVAKRHRGRAWAQSEGPGRGSTFVLEFPIST
ncbi:MAG: HAMP domain-containing sensor histidine kinase [Bryobacteraceae bacterium]